MRCGVLYFSKRYNEANNKYLKLYDPKQELKRIIQFDTNHLYGYAISQFLPTNGFKWIDPKEFDSNKYNTNSSKACLLEFDFE